MSKESGVRAKKMIYDRHWPMDDFHIFFFLLQQKLFIGSLSYYKWIYWKITRFIQKVRNCSTIIYCVSVCVCVIHTLVLFFHYDGVYSAFKKHKKNRIEKYENGKKRVREVRVRSFKKSYYSLLRLQNSLKFVYFISFFETNKNPATTNKICELKQCKSKGSSLIYV